MCLLYNCQPLLCFRTRPQEEEELLWQLQRKLDYIAITSLGFFSCKTALCDLCEHNINCLFPPL